jgi:hypothetical protein
MPQSMVVRQRNANIIQAPRNRNDTQTNFGSEDTQSAENKAAGISGNRRHRQDRLTAILSAVIAFFK